MHRLGRDQPGGLALPHDTGEDATEHLFSPALPDARQRGMIRQSFVQGVAAEPADREIDLRLTHQSPVMDDAEQEPRQHQAYGDFGIDARAAIIGTIKVGHLSAKPPKVENLIDLHQHMVIGDQIPQRPGDEKLQLTPLFLPQHRSLSTTDKQSESEIWGFFNSPQWTVFPTNEILKEGEPVKAPLVQAHGRTHVSLRRNSTARSANDRVHRRSPLCPWCRA